MDNSLISRQAAIDAIRASTSKYKGFMEMEMYTDYDAVEAIEGLPSVQPEPICINLNESIKVKLTDWGKEIYCHQYDRTNRIAGREICKPEFPKEDENGYTEFHLWRFIELYGEYMGMIKPNVIDPLEIIYEG